MSSENEPVVISDTEIVRFLAIRGALRLEAHGMKKRGVSARALANEVMGTNYRTAAKTLEMFSAWLDGQRNRA